LHILFTDLKPTDNSNASTVVTKLLQLTGQTVTNFYTHVHTY